MNIIIDLVIIIVCVTGFSLIKKTDTIFGTGFMVYTIIFFVKLIIDIIKYFI